MKRWLCCCGGRARDAPSSDWTIKVWDVATGQCERTLRDHASRCVFALAPCAEGKVASGSVVTIKVWRS